MPTATSDRPTRHNLRFFEKLIGTLDANNEIDSSALVANADGSLFERAEYIQSLLLLGASSLVTAQALYLPRVAPKAIAAAGTSLTTVLSPVTLFTVTGVVLVRVWAAITTGLTSTGTNGTLAIGVTGNTGALIAATTADGTNFPTGSIWAGDTSPTVKGEALSSGALNGVLINASDIIATIATNSMTAGVITFYCEWRPVSVGASVVAA